MTELVAPSSRAWFRHVVGGRPRLGVAEPAGQTVTLRDLGDVDPAHELAQPGGLDSEQLRSRALHAGTLDASTVEFALPLDRPSKILCLGKNFAAHAAEFGVEVPPEPIFFTKLLDALSPHGANVVLPHWVESRVDHEVELAVILGFQGPPRRYVDPTTAMDLVAGYSIFNDVTARGMQGDDRDKKLPWLRSKSFDTFGPFGPWVVPADALDARDLDISLHVDDELRQHSRTSRHVVDIPHAIAYLSKHTSLRSGDLIAMGTPAGVGPLRDGDVVRCEIEGIGRLTHGVRRERR